VVLRRGSYGVLFRRARDGRPPGSAPCMRRRPPTTPPGSDIRGPSRTPHRATAAGARPPAEGRVVPSGSSAPGGRLTPGDPNAALCHPSNSSCSGGRVAGSGCSACCVSGGGVGFACPLIRTSVPLAWTRHPQCRPSNSSCSGGRVAGSGCSVWHVAGGGGCAASPDQNICSTCLDMAPAVPPLEQPLFGGARRRVWDVRFGTLPVVADAPRPLIRTSVAIAWTRHPQCRLSNSRCSGGRVAASGMFGLARCRRWRMRCVP